MINLLYKRCKHEGFAKQLSYDVDGCKSAKVCALHAREQVYNFRRYTPWPFYGVVESKWPSYVQYDNDRMIGTRH